MNLKEIKELLELMKSADVAELELEKDNTKIKIKKASGGQPMLYQPPAVQAAPPQPVLQQPQPGAEPGLESEKHVVIKSPMVGTFYRSLAPDAPPYVQEGDMVAEGQTVCIIEAMKLMNEIKAEIKGRITRILIENGQAVEYNQPLFQIEPLDKAPA